MYPYVSKYHLCRSKSVNGLKLLYSCVCQSLHMLCIHWYHLRFEHGWKPINTQNYPAGSCYSGVRVVNGYYRSWVDDLLEASNSNGISWNNIRRRYVDCTHWLVSHPIFSSKDTSRPWPGTRNRQNQSCCWSERPGRNRSAPTEVPARFIV